MISCIALFRACQELPYLIGVIVWKGRSGNLHSVCSVRGTEVCSVDRSVVSMRWVNGYL